MKDAAPQIRNEIICGRDVEITIDHKKLLQAESVEISRSSKLHAVRSCFVDEDIALIRGRTVCKANISGLRFRKPFENLSFADLDNFTMEMNIGDKKIILHGCMWDDFIAAADREKFRERISVVARSMETEDIE